MAVNWRELFPTKFTCIIFACYMSLFVGQGIFVTASQEANNSYNYNIVTVVMLTEVVKLLASSVLYCRQNDPSSLIHNVRKEVNVLLLYFVPAFLYCLYNNLAFVNLSIFDPTTYYLLLQFRVVITGVLFQIIFKKMLSRRQWISLCLLTIGCMAKQIEMNVDLTNHSESASSTVNSTLQIRNPDSKVGAKNTKGFDLSFSALFIVAQTIFSCLAGVYNEYLLKDRGSDVDIYLQNIFMYIDSIICNGFLLLLRGELLDAFTYEKLRTIFRLNVVVIIINNAAIGIVTSFFLKYMNSILKTFASALELIFTAILCYLLFGLPIHLNTIVAIAIVSFAIYLYSQSPVVNLGKARNPLNIHYSNNESDHELLLDPSDSQTDIV